MVSASSAHNQSYCRTKKAAEKKINCLYWLFRLKSEYISFITEEGGNEEVNRVKQIIQMKGLCSKTKHITMN